MRAILLLVENEANERLLAEHLSEAYEIVRGEPGSVGDTQFDLCLVDDASFTRCRRELDRRKRDVEPAFLPYLLLSSAERLDRRSPIVEGEVDDVLRTPVEKAELDARVEALLRTRSLSLSLEERTERSDERFRSLFEAVPDPVLVVGPDGRIGEANEAFRTAFGVSEAAVRNAPVTDLEFSPRDRVEHLFLRLEPGDVADAPTLVEWEGDGGTVFAELTVEPVATAGGETERVGVFHDVTALKEREAQLLEQNERLEEFARTVAHDLRNPLGIANGFLEQASATGDLAHLDPAADALDRMEQLVDELLTLARQGEVVVEPVQAGLRDVAMDAWANVTTTGARLTVERDATFEADPGRLQQALENLIRNAIEHGDGAPSIRIGVVAAGDGFYVEDDGPGIPSSDAEQVFEAGYTTTDDGTGFGLPIVRQIIDGHGWSIRVVEGRDGGARFEITGVESLRTEEDAATG